jgi:hypothetical protein
MAVAEAACCGAGRNTQAGGAIPASAGAKWEAWRAGRSRRAANPASAR